MVASDETLAAFISSPTNGKSDDSFKGSHTFNRQESIQGLSFTGISYCRSIPSHQTGSVVAIGCRQRS